MISFLPTHDVPKQPQIEQRLAYETSTGCSKIFMGRGFQGRGASWAMTLTLVNDSDGQYDGVD
jgi:hypothetical protein